MGLICAQPDLNPVTATACVHAYKGGQGYGDSDRSRELIGEHQRSSSIN